MTVVEVMFSFSAQSHMERNLEGEKTPFPRESLSFFHSPRIP